MPCYAPITAYYSKEVSSTTKKRKLIFNSLHSHSGISVHIPCGQCTGCKLEKSRQWAMRCVHEAQLHAHNSFVTLTYDDQSLPDEQSLVPDHLQKFHKRLHNTLLRKRGHGIRYYACGEYGETTNRPHYHSLVFGYQFPDLVYHKKAASGEPLYTSKTLEKLWPYGHSLIGQVTFESAAYVARYVTKKITGPTAEAHYMGREPEFGVMSRRPGIGLHWLLKYQEQTYDHDRVVLRGKEMPPPKYYDKKLEQLDKPTFTIIKLHRRRSRKYSVDNTKRRLRVRERVTKAKLNLRRKEL